MVTNENSGEDSDNETKQNNTLHPSPGRCFLAAQSPEEAGREELKEELEELEKLEREVTKEGLAKENT